MMTRVTMRAAVARMLGMVGLMSLNSCFLVRDTVNSSPGLRWWLLSNFGTSRLCPEMLNRSASLRVGGESGVSGRFFPSYCDAKARDVDQVLEVAFSGSGYAWTPVAGRIGFEVFVQVAYRPDFQMTEDALYVWARPHQVIAGPNFKVLSVENSLVNWAVQGPGAYLATAFGQQLLSSALAQGFTVVRTGAGDDFSLGMLAPPARPVHPFDTDEERYVAFNENLTLHPNQVDFLGPLIVVDEDQRLALRWKVEGPATEALLLSRAVADQWRAELQKGVPQAVPKGPVLGSWVVQPGEQAFKAAVPPGHYSLVFENTRHVGSVAPAWSPLAGFGTGPTSISVIAELYED